MRKTCGFSARMNLLLALAPVSFLGAMVATPAMAGENYALIVAATKYPNLDEKFWLEGPANDAKLVRDFLLNTAPVTFEAQNVTTLATEPGLTDPTHDAIIGALHTIRDEVKEGDFVYLHFSGHGSQEPAIVDINEPDGRDEVFLPSDTGMASGDAQEFPNALRDDEIAIELDALRDRGAFVWAVFDSCHSGTVTRGAPANDGAADRKIDPEDLGIPESAFAKVDEDAGSRAVPLAAATFSEDGTTEKGGLVAFFAAQSTETAQEKNMTIETDAGPVEEKYGVFTFTLFSALAKNPGMTYRQLAQSVLSSYTAQNALKPTPLFEGNLDMPVFGSTDAASVQQWPTLVNADGSVSISAGQLHGLTIGTKLLLLPNPAADDDAAIGTFEVSQIQTLRSLLKPVADGGKAALKPADIPKGAYVRLAEQHFNFELDVARPEVTDGNAAEVSIVNAALDAIAADAAASKRTQPLKIRLVEAGAQADVRLAVLSEVNVAGRSGKGGAPSTSGDPTPKLWMLPSNGDISLAAADRSPDMQLPSNANGDRDFQKLLSSNLVTVYRATGLSQLASANTFKPSDFSLAVGVQKAGASEVTMTEATDTPIVNAGDRLYVALDNASGKPMDLNVLYIDHDYGITLVCKVQLAPNSKILAPMADLNDSDRGSEKIIAVINESGKELTDLSMLEQRGVIARHRGVGEEGIMGMIADLGAGDSTRGPTATASRTSNAPRGAVVMVPLEVLPATGDTPAIDTPLADQTLLTGDCGNQA